MSVTLKTVWNKTFATKIKYGVLYLPEPFWFDRQVLVSLKIVHVVWMASETRNHF